MTTALPAALPAAHTVTSTPTLPAARSAPRPAPPVHVGEADPAPATAADQDAPHVVVVDVETSALRPTPSKVWRGAPPAPYGALVEIAWWNLTTGEHAVFVPTHNRQWVRGYGHPQALSVNGYLDRLADAAQAGEAEVERLYQQLTGARFAGFTVAFDSERWLAGSLFSGRERPDPWHHRLLDIGNYASGVWGLPAHELIKSDEVCRRLQVAPGDHSAWQDVRAGGECLVAIGAVPPPPGGTPTPIPPGRRP